MSGDGKAGKKVRWTFLPHERPAVSPPGWDWF
jgi:hypothetical protein